MVSIFRQSFALRGLSCSSLLAVCSGLENGVESVVAKSIGNGDDELNTAGQSISFKDEHSQFMVRILHSAILDPKCSKHEAAIKLQKVYKSFRTRRKLADSAVLVEQSWWKLLDFAELKHSSISFFGLDKHETAISRWSRARTRAAKVGKGLCKNGKAQKLVLRHWLEAIDPRHRYGHNLHFYYVKWLNSQSKEPFFYWLDIGEGREVNLIEKCPRSKLQQQCIKYLVPMERKAYEVVVEDGKLLYKQTGELLHTANEQKGSKWIFVLSTSRNLYVGKKKKGSFQHSSFLAGGATLAAGRIVAEKGILKAVWPHSGHYRPTPENFQDCISFLQDNKVDLTDVKLDSTDEEEKESVGKKRGVYLRSSSSEDDSTENDYAETEENENASSSDIVKTAVAVQAPKSGGLHSFSRKLTTLEIPSKENLVDELMSENQTVESSINDLPPGSPVDVYDTAEEPFSSEPDCNMLKKSMPTANDGSKAKTITKESNFQRISSHKELKSYQLGKQLSCKWSTGVGPRISCLRDYQSGLQCHALEKVNLSPRSKHR